MATIIMRTDLLQSPKVIRLSARCSCSPILIMGGLYWLWATAQGHSNAGLISSLDAEIIDHTTGIKGFGVALESVGWIVTSASGVQITEFDQYFGESAKVREQSRLRTARCRAAKRDTTVTGNATSNGEARNSVSEPQYGTERNENETKGNETPKAKKTKHLPAVETWEPIPDPFNVPVVHDALAEWATYRDVERKDKWTAVAQKRTLSQFAKAGWDAESLVFRIEEAMARAWQGLFFAQDRAGPPKSARPPLVLNGYEPAQIPKPAKISRAEGEAIFGVKP